MMGAAGRILPGLSAAIARTVPFPPEIRAARFVDDAPLLGALALAHSASRSRTRRARPSSSDRVVPGTDDTPCRGNPVKSVCGPPARPNPG